MASKWYEIYPAQEKRVELNDFPTKQEIFKKMQENGIVSKDNDIDNFEFDNDCSFIGVYDNNGELLYKFEIQ